MSDDPTKTNTPVAAAAAQTRETKEDPSARSEPGGIALAFGFLMGIAVWCLIGLGVAAIFSEWAGTLWRNHWLLILCTFVGIAVLFGAALWLDAWLKRATTGARQLVLTFGWMPLLLLVTAAGAFLPPQYRVFSVEIAIWLVASTIPGLLYYLFLATRRPTILNEYVSNLGRLGLLKHRPRRSCGNESEAEHRARVDGYFQRFESVYGELRFDRGGINQLPTPNRTGFVEWLFNNAISDAPSTLYPPSTRQLPQVIVGLSDILASHVLVPLALVTLLAAIGWLMTLQPDPRRTEIDRGAVANLETQNADAALQQQPAAAVRKEGQPAASAPRPAAESPHAADGQKRSNQSDGSPRETQAAPRPGAPATMFSLSWTPTNLAFLGAYFFGLQQLFRRFARRDLGPNALLSFAIRIILAFIATWVATACYALVTSTSLPTLLGETASPPGLLVLAFTLGVFPRILWQLVTAVLTKSLKLKVAIPSFESKQTLSELDGLTIWHESRLEEEDIENVPNMATADVVHLMLHTQTPAVRLIDWVDQAILLKVLGPEKRDATAGRAYSYLRARGIRTATQFLYVLGSPTTTSADPQDADLLSHFSAMRLAIAIEGNVENVCAWRGIELLDARASTPVVATLAGSDVALPRLIATRGEFTEPESLRNP